MGRASFPGASRRGYSLLVARGWNRDASELVMNFGRSGLHVGSEDFCVVSEVLVESVAIPPSFDFHDVEWETAEEVF